MRRMRKLPDFSFTRQIVKLTDKIFPVRHCDHIPYPGES